MSERANYAPGTPCWVDLATPDLEASAGFYGELFGWELPERADSRRFGGYRRAILDGAEVAGAANLMSEDQPPAWTTYVSVADAAATAEAVTAAGGSVVNPPMAVSDFGSLALFTDPTGAFFGVWQPGAFAGAERVDEPGALSWNELGTRDTAAAKRFYGAVFGWAAEDEDSPAGAYTVWKLGEARVGGMLDIAALGLPAEVPPHWLAYFAVEDADEAVARARAAGGQVMVGPNEVPAGRFAVIADQFGAVFSVIQPAGREPAPGA